MNFPRFLTLAALTSTLLLSTPLRAESGAVEFGTFTPPHSGGQFVEINLKSNLLAMAGRLAQKDEPDAAEMLKSIQSVHVRVIGLDEGNRAKTEEQITQIRGKLEKEGWEKNVTVKDEGSDVAIYTKLRGSEAVEGIVVTVIDGKNQAVLVNVVGDLRPEKLIALGERFDIEPLKQLHDKLGGKSGAKHPAPTGETSESKN
jgi:hypothetical protein